MKAIHKTDTNVTILKITLKVTRLNTPTKRQNVRQIRKFISTLQCPQESCFKYIE